MSVDMKLLLTLVIAFLVIACITPIVTGMVGGLGRRATTEGEGGW